MFGLAALLEVFAGALPWTVDPLAAAERPFPVTVLVLTPRGVAAALSPEVEEETSLRGWATLAALLPEVLDGVADVLRLCEDICPEEERLAVVEELLVAALLEEVLDGVADVLRLLVVEEELFVAVEELLRVGEEVEVERFTVAELLLVEELLPEVREGDAELLRVVVPELLVELELLFVWEDEERLAVAELERVWVDFELLTDEDDEDLLDELLPELRVAVEVVCLEDVVPFVDPPEVRVWA